MLCVFLFAQPIQDNPPFDGSTEADPTGGPRRRSLGGGVAVQRDAKRVVFPLTSCDSQALGVHLKMLDTGPVDDSTSVSINII